MTEKTAITLELFPKPNVPNANGIFYPDEVVENMKNQLQKMIDENKAFVFVDSKSDDYYPNRLQLQNVIGKIIEIEFDKVIFKPIDIEKYSNLILCIKSDPNMYAISTIAQGNINPEGTKVVNNDEYILHGMILNMKKDLIKKEENNDE